ncbi:hypothetical protein C0J52_24877 [Blattella germanica]|nr:hypothetical protein C0J52_24877 [Blattella germanica]
MKFVNTLRADSSIQQIVKAKFENNVPKSNSIKNLVPYLHIMYSRYSMYSVISTALDNRAEDVLEEGSDLYSIEVEFENNIIDGGVVLSTLGQFLEICEHSNIRWRAVCGGLLNLN